MLDKVKLALRISNDKLDSDIQLWIDSALAEMVRVGINTNVDDALIQSAVITYCKMQHTSDSKKFEQFGQSFTYQINNLRNTGEYQNGM